LSSSVPSCFNPPQIIHVHLSNNRLSGPLTNGFYNSSSLITIPLTIMINPLRKVSLCLMMNASFSFRG
jgi:hypothetical protein